MDDTDPNTNLTSHTFKILIIGESSVGKSSLLLRYTDNSFPKFSEATIGVDFKIKQIRMNRHIINLALWDTAGTEQFRALSPSFYRGAHGVIFVYDVTIKKTLEKLDSWLEEVNTYCETNIVKMVVGNKIDKIRKIPREEGMAWARKHSALFFETSAKTNEEVVCAFEELIRKILETSILNEGNKTHQGVTLEQTNYNISWKPCCQ